MIRARALWLAVFVPSIAGCTGTAGMPPPQIGESTGSTGDLPAISTAPPGPTAPAAEDDDGGSSTGLGGLESASEIVIEVGYGGGGKVMPGTSWTQAWGEAFVLQYSDGMETVLCVMSWEATMTEVLTTCTDCEFAFTIENGAPEVEVDEGGACSEYGIDREAIAGQAVQIGYSMNQVLQAFDAEWVSIGDAEFDAASGDFYYEWAEEV